MDFFKDKIMKVYVDLDGTLADYNGWMLEHDKNALKDRDLMYKLMLDPKLECYKHFKQLPHTEFYMDMLRHNKDWYILSALPKKENIAKYTDKVEETYKMLERNKIDWCVAHGIPKSKIIICEFAATKQEYCKPGDVLYDDNSMIRKQWESKGGKAFAI